MGAELESFRAALDRVDTAIRAVYQGDHRPFSNLWSPPDDASLFGAFGPARVGWESLNAVLPWVAARYRNGTVEIENVVVWEGPEAALTVGYERSEVSIDVQAVQRSTIRITHVFRRKGLRWMLIHRH